MLRLSPGDNQGLRYVLLGWLLDVGEHQAPGEFLPRYEGEGRMVPAFAISLPKAAITAE